MEENRANSKPYNLLSKIKGLTRCLLKDICNGQSPVLYLDRYRNYCSNPTGNCSCSYEKQQGQDMLTLQRECHAHRLNVLLRVLLIVQKLLRENKHGSKRDIYYMYPSVFSEQAVVDRTINDICILFKCSRHNLNVKMWQHDTDTDEFNSSHWCLLEKGNKSSYKGPSWNDVFTKHEKKYAFVLSKFFFSDLLTAFSIIGCPNYPRPIKQLVMGWLRFMESGRKIDCMNSPNTAYSIPVHAEEVKGILILFNFLYLCFLKDCWTSIDITGVAQYILIVEKETVFQRLADDQFCRANRCIVVTGRGYPDVSTRRFLRLLMEKLHLPAYCLVDCDPYGFDILTTYRFGSMQMAYDAKFLRLPDVRWLGAFPSDAENYQLPKRCLLPLTVEDKKKAEAMLLRCYLHQEAPQWRSELEIMLKTGVKFEIEALSVSSISFLSEKYVSSKIQDGVFI
ncbi:hypothetical protein C5167_018644 [Papaver somniferum]|uniref:DNA topoisomerase (ATP-hydrolyzing) n=1 Tax=Papaver somniferum TaxID=3469 RepID=A0A4Y7IRV8_PAPSO|nr:hypothetical protein C5167_018644 [Papaver somniferum]